MWAISLLAADDPLSRPELIFGIGGLVLALLAGAAAVALADRWRRRAAAPAHADTDVLTTYRDMFEHGEITEAEYADLRRKVAEKVKAAPAPAAPPAPDPATGRPDPAKLATPVPPQVAPPAPFATGARIVPREAPAAPAPPAEPPPPPGTA